MEILIYNSPHANHLEWCLESIKTHSPNSKVHVLGFENSRLVRDFEREYNHKSTNPFDDVIRSFNRWIIMLEYCHRNNITEFFTCDSDVLIFCDIDKEAPPLQMAGHTGCCFVRNLAVLNLFVQAIFEFYEKNKWRFYANHCNVSDMTVWDEFFHNRDTGTMFHFKDSGMWCANINLSQGLEMKAGKKRVLFYQGFPSGESENRPIRLKNLHCHGSCKPRMKEIWELSRSTVGTNEPKEFV